ncbi:MAG: hypothetical protein ACXVAX_09245 [Pseudobdellovibrio sp.]
MKTLFLTISLLGNMVMAAIYPRVETLMDAQVSGSQVKIQVQSGGCTWKNSFRISQHFDAAQGMTKLTFVRLYPDFCEMYFPDGIVLTYTMQDLRIQSGKSYYIGNPILPTAVE